MIEPAAIVRIVSIEDTRAYEEVGDRWVAVPGSGTVSQCARCGRDHEVHATVALADGGVAVVGTSCARGTSLDAPLRKGANAAKRLAALRPRLKDAQRRLELARKVQDQVAALPVPTPERTTGTRSISWDTGEQVPAVRVGDQLALRYNEWQTHEQLADLATDKWTCAREFELREAAGLDPRRPVYSIEEEVERIRKQVRSAEARLAKLIQG